MYEIAGAVRDYAWGSPHLIPDLTGLQTDGGPVAEMWFGAHASAPSQVTDRDGAVTALDALIAADPEGCLGGDVRRRFREGLPYLLKLIAADTPLSLQVHPTRSRAREGYAAEQAAGVPVDAPTRNYRDENHKPELVYALTTFEAVCGFRAPRRAAEMFAGLDAPLARELQEILAADPSPTGMCTAFTRLLDPATRPAPEAVAEVVAACAARLGQGSPSPRADRTVALLARQHPGDPGIVTSLLLNPVTLHPGEAMFVPAGGVHAYISGLGVEIMASSENTLRAGLTPKHVDVAEVLRNVDYVAAPPIRIAPEIFHGATRVFYAPVDDFELSVTELTALEGDDPQPLPGRGPRVVLCVAGEVRITAASGEERTLARGAAAFVPASDGALQACGAGTIVQADVP